MDTTALLAMLPSGIRIALSGRIRRFVGFRRIDGDAKTVCTEVVRRCYDRKRGCYTASPETYRDFWARDFGRVVPSLLYLGFEKETTRTFRYALERYDAHGCFRLVISPQGRMFDFPTYAPDGFALFVYGLSCLRDRRLVSRYRRFLEAELRRFAEGVLEPETGLVRCDRRFSEAQDYAVRSASCYTASMCHLLSRSADSLGLDNPLTRYDFQSLIHRTYWNGTYYLDDRSGKTYVSGDACIAPFWTDAARAPDEQLPSVLEALDDAGITAPLPARYGAGTMEGREMIWMDRVNPWQRDAVWTCLGLQFLQVIERHAQERYRRELARYEAFIQRIGCFPEVLFARNLALFRSRTYQSETAMLWAADLWRMLESRDRALRTAK